LWIAFSFGSISMELKGDENGICTPLRKQPRMTVKARVRKKSARAAPQGSVRRNLYSLRLYVTGQTPCSAASIRNIRYLCEEFLKDRFELQVIDPYERPELAKQAHVIATPTLIKPLPQPLRRIIGDLSDRRKVLLGLDLKES
jgi:circadian clock protein KaiB